MLKDYDGNSITPKQAAKIIINRLFDNFVDSEDIPDSFNKATEREIELVGEQFWKIVGRIKRDHLK